MGAGEARLQIHEPARGSAAGAVLVLRGALPAVPVLPPDPLEMVQLEHEEGDDPEENLGPRHALNVSIPGEHGMGRAAQSGSRPVLAEASTGWSGPRSDRSTPKGRRR